MQYVRIPVDDVAISATFYGDLLGVTPQLHANGDYAEVETPDLLIAIYGPAFESYDRRTPELDRPRLTIWLDELPDDHIIQVLQDHGLRIPSPDHRTTRDPDGHTLTWTAPLVEEVPLP